MKNRSARSNSQLNQDVSGLADKHGLGDVIGREISEPRDMEELNGKFKTLEMIVKSLRLHINDRLSRLNLPRCVAVIFVMFAMCFVFAATASATTNRTINVTLERYDNEFIPIYTDNFGEAYRDLTILNQPTHGEIEFKDTISRDYYDYTNTELALTDNYRYSYKLIKVFEEDELFIVDVNISIPNERPDATKQEEDTLEDQTYISLENYASDDDGDTLTYSIAPGAGSGPSHGTLTWLDTSRGKFQYTPDANYVGWDTIKYDVTDGLQSNTNEYKIYVKQVNDDPVRVDEISDFTVDEDASTITYDLNDYFYDSDTEFYDTNPDTLTYSIFNVENPSLINTSLSGSILTLDFSENQNGIAPIGISVRDSEFRFSHMNFKVTVNPINDLPVLSNPISNFSVDEDSPNATINLTNVFSDVEGELTYSVSNSNESVLTASISGSNLVLDFLDDQNGSVEITITATDSDNATVYDTFTVTVNSVSDDPIASSDSISTDEDSARTYALDASDPDGDALSFTITNQPANGSLGTVDAGGNVTYTPDTDFYGADSFSFIASDGTTNSNEATITIDVISVNDQPTVIASIEDMEVPFNTPNTTIDMTPYFDDSEDDSLTYSASANNDLFLTPFVSGNTLTLDYINNMHGSAFITVTATDSDGGSISSTFQVTSYVEIDKTDELTMDVKSIAEFIASKINNKQTLDINMSATSSDRNVVTVSTIDNYLNNKLSLTFMTFGQLGSANINLKVTKHYQDGFETNSLGFPVPKFVDRSTTITFKVIATEINDAPVAVDDSVETGEGSVITISPLANDTDEENDTLTIVNVTGPSLGSVTFTSDSITFDPNAQFEGLGLNESDTTTFTYTISDGEFTDTASVSVTISGENDTPIVLNSIADAAVDEDADVVVIDLSNVFNDVDGDAFTLSVSGNTNPNLLEDLLLDNQTLTLTFLADQNGSTDITITADDGNGGQGTDTFSITVNSVNDKPVTQNFTFTMDEDTSFNFWSTFIANSSDIETHVKAASFRNFVNGSQAKAVFTPDENFVGDASFEIQPIDTENLRGDWAKVTVTVNPVNDPPVIENPIENITVDEDTADITIDLNTVFSDIEGALSYNITNPNTWLLNASLSGSSLTMDFLDDQHGNAEITIVAIDSDNDSVSESFQVIVNPVNDLPLVVNPITDISVFEDADDQVIDLSNVFKDPDDIGIVLDPPTEIANSNTLTVSVSENSNPNMVETSLPDNQSLTLSFIEDQFGSADITLSALSADGETVSDTFTVTVNAINDKPIVLNPFEDLVVYEDTEDIVIDLSNVFDDIEDENLTYFLFANTNQNLIKSSIVDHTLSLSLLDNQFGNSSFLIIARDSEEKQIADDFTITVNPVNDAPSFTLLSTEITVEEDDGLQSISNLVTNISPGPDNESDQTVLFNVSTNAPELFAQLPTMDSNGLLTFAPIAGSEGTAEVYISLIDDGGTDNGGIDSSEIQTVVVTILSVQAKVILLGSNGNGIAGAEAQYRNGQSWVTLPGQTNSLGELELPENLSGSLRFRMMYNNTSQSITQNLDEKEVVVFQTVNVLVELIDSSGAYLTSDSGEIEYTYQGWKSFGNTDDLGIATKEMLPGNYAFRMTYGNARSIKRQDISINSTVSFQTIPVSVSLRDSYGNSLTDQTEFTYRGIQELSVNGAAIGDGSILVELLPATYRFRATYENATVELRQNVDANSNVEFQTDHVTIALKNSVGELITDDTAKYEYYSNSWNTIGSNEDGQIAVELLPKTYRFRINYKNTTKEIEENTKFISDIAFETAPFTVELRDSANDYIPSERAEGNGMVSYYSGGWNDIGESVEGKVSIELLPNFYNFRMAYEHASADEKNESNFNTVTFNTDLYEVELRDSNDELFVDADAMVEYQSGEYHELGPLVNGVASKELLTQKYDIYPIRMEYNNTKQTIRNNGDNPLLTTFHTRNILVQLIDSAGYLLEDEFEVEYNKNGWHSVGTSDTGQMSLELLPSYYQIRIEHKGVKATNYNASVSNSNRIIDFQTGQVFAVNDDAVQVKTNEWIDFYQHMELLPKRYDFRFVNGVQRGFGIEAGYINEIELKW